MAKLTVRGIEALKPKKAGYKVTADRGLYVRVAPDGSKTWLVRYVVAGKQIQARLPRAYGSSGADGHMSLAQAVAENARVQSLARDGIDFQVQRAEAERARAEARAAAIAANAPFRTLFETWLADGVSRKDGNAELRRSFEKDILPTIGDKPVRELTDTQLLDLLRNVGRKRGRARTAERMLTEMRQLFRWAIKRQPWRSLLAQGNPAELVELKLVVPHGYEPRIRERTLSPDEIRELRDIFSNMVTAYEAAKNKRIADRPVQRETQIALWICLGTGCRIGELLQARWEHVDLEKAMWFVPRENTKTHVDWQVYLSQFALQQFKALHDRTGKSDWCFPASQQEGHVFVKSVSKQVGDRQTLFKNRKPLAHRRNDDSLVLANGKNGEWTPHDLRRTASTMMQALRISPDVIDRCQNHVLPGSKVRRHYLHHDYIEEKREAWRLLGERIDAILSAGNVVPLKRAGRETDQKIGCSACESFVSLN
ncbi:site-specific integrase [Variovorax defluvii]|uniref:Site-specific integrase n=1 Tax=Variovorax defluvii TaxID=913761 RepID=A0ABP8HKS8_9BURK